MTATARQLEAPTLRWSSVRDCPRKATFEATGAPARERTLAEERTLYRGKSVGREFACFLAARERQKGHRRWRIYVASGIKGEWPRRYITHDRGKAAFIVEEAFRWPLGVLHPDIHILETDTIVEVLSSVHASEGMRRSKLVQLVGQIHYSGAKAGALVVVNPTSLDDDIYPIARTSRLYGELLSLVEERVAQVQAWAANPGLTPPRVCGRPADAISHFCLYADHCFQGWEAPPLPLVEDEEALHLVSRLYVAKRRESHVKADLRTLEQERRDLEQQLAPILPVGKHDAGGLEVTRSRTQRKPTFQWEKAEAAGVFEPGLFGEYFKAGAAYDTWRLERLGDQPLDEVA